MTADAPVEEPARAVDPYANYAAWKAWDGASAPTDRDLRYFAAEFGDMPLRGLRVLEIGFGNGGFLAFAKGEGAVVAGIEINAAMCEAARRRGFEASDASLPELAARGEWMRKRWIPACAGMTEEGAGTTGKRAGMTERRAGMTERRAGMTGGVQCVLPR